MQEPAATPPTAAPASSTDSAVPSPQKEKAALNANAKSFVPTKLESAAAVVAASTPHIATAMPMSPGKVGLQSLPPPGGMYGMSSPNARGVSAANAPPFMPLNPAALRGGAMPPGMPFFPPGMPMSPLYFGSMAPPASPLVNVGNASLAALRSNVPPKFCCILLIGIPGVGKTTVGRDVVASLQDDKIPWQFFSGSNFVKEGPTPYKTTPWETTKFVFDALGQKLDALLAKQSATDTVTKGLVIDKNCKGVEDLHYLMAMLRTRGLPLVGIVSLDVPDTEVIVSRIGGGEEQQERIKHHRVIQTRLCDAARSMHLLRTIDASKSKEEVARSLRTMVLGLSAQNPATGARTPHARNSTQTLPGGVEPLGSTGSGITHPVLSYSDSACPMVDDYLVYCNVMTSLFTMVVKGAQTFPGVTEYAPLSTKDMESKLATFKANYVVRRKADGTKYLLVNDGTGLYLVPRHMRAVLRIPREAWLGVPLTHVGKFVLDGDLVRLSKDRTKEKFIVFDVLHWAEPNSTVNTVSRLTWTERQEKLNAHLCLETSAFYPTKTSEVIVVLQVQTLFDKAVDLLEQADYPCEGLVFQSKRQIEDSYLWRAPTSITVDLRLGAVVGTVPADGAAAAAAPPTPNAAGSGGLEASQSQSLGPRQYSFSDRNHATPTEPPATRTFAVEVYSTLEKAYIRLGTDTVNVRRPEVVEGSICICGIAPEPDAKKPSWVFHRVRHDVSRAAYKPLVEKILKECLIPKTALMNWLQPGSGDAAATGSAATAATPAAAAGAAAAASTLPTVSVGGQVPQLGTAVQPDRPQGSATAATTSMSRGGFGSSLETQQPAAAAASGGNSSVLQHFEKAKYMPSTAGGDTMVDQLKRVTGGSVKVHNASQQPPAVTSGGGGSNAAASAAPIKMSLIESVAGGTVSVVKSTATPPPAPEASAAGGRHAAKEKRHKTCCDCQGNGEDGRTDQRDRRFYCYTCWAKLGTDFCSECGAFAKGYRESTRRRVSPFYCDACWDSFNANKKEKETPAEGTAAAEGAADTEKKPKAEKKSKAKEGEEPAAVDPAAAANGDKPAKEKKPRVRKASKSSSPVQDSTSAAEPPAADAASASAAPPADAAEPERADAPAPSNDAAPATSSA